MDKSDSSRDDRTVQPTYILPPGYYPDWETEDQVSLADYFRVLWKRRYLILAGTLGAALVAFVVSQLLPREYETSATLLIQPPLFQTELRPEPLTVETYESIIDSGSVRKEVRRRLESEGLLQPDQPLGQLETEIYASKIRQEAYRPLIDLVVRSQDPEKARLVADFWAETAVEESRGLATRGKEGTLQFIQTEYPETKARLTQLENELRSTQDRYDQALQQAEDRWLDRIAAFRIEWDIPTLEKQLEAMQERLTQNIPRLSELQLEVQRTRDKLAQLKTEIKQHPQFVVLSKAITDDALWERAGNDFSAETAEQLKNLQLRSQQLNPVYTSLLQQLANTQVEYDSLAPQEQYLTTQIAEQKQAIRQLNETIISKKATLAKLERERDTELARIERERDAKVAELEREVEGSKKTFEMLSEQWENARLAQAEEDQDVKIGAYAVVPTSPVSPRPLLNTAIAFTVGLMVSIMAAFVVEFVQSGNLVEDSGSQSREQISSLALKRSVSG